MALKKINHPGVCGIVDMELDDTLAFIVTELIEGKNLKDDVAANGRYVGDDLERLARKPYMRPASSIATSNPPM